MTTLTEYIAYTAMSEAVYDRDSHDQALGEEALRALGIEATGTQLLDNETGFAARVYDYNGKHVIVFRGTDFNEPGFVDFKYGDIQLALGFQARQWANALTFIDTVKTTFGLGNIVFAGHSLGGGLAGMAAAMFNKDAFVVAPAPFKESVLQDWFIPDYDYGTTYGQAQRDILHGIGKPTEPVLPYLHAPPYADGEYEQYLADQRGYLLAQGTYPARIAAWDVSYSAALAAKNAAVNSVIGDHIHAYGMIDEVLQQIPGIRESIIKILEFYSSPFLGNVTSLIAQTALLAFQKLGVTDAAHFIAEEMNFTVGGGVSIAEIIAKHLTPLHELVMASQKLGEPIGGVSGIFTKDADLRDSFLINAAVSGALSHPVYNNPIISPEPGVVERALFNSINVEGKSALYKYFYDLFKNVAAKGAAGGGINSTTSGGTIHSGVVKLALGILRDASQNTTVVQGVFDNLKVNTKSGGLGAAFAGSQTSNGENPFSDKVAIDLRAIVQRDTPTGSHNITSPRGGQPQTIQDYAYREKSGRALGVSDIDSKIIDGFASDLGTNPIKVAELMGLDFDKIKAGEQALAEWTILIAQGGSDTVGFTHNALTFKNFGTLNYADLAHVIIGGGGNDTITGSNKDDFLLGGGGNDEFYVSGGQDLDLGQSGNDTFHTLVAQGEDIPDTPKSKNYGIKFVGGSGYDTIKYDLVDPNPEFVGPPTPPPEKGVEITSLRKQKLIPDNPNAPATDASPNPDVAVIVVKNRITEKSGKDLLPTIERVKLTDRADLFNVDDLAFEVPILVDMADFTPQAEFFKKDYDHVSFEPLTHGIKMINGIGDNFAQGQNNAYTLGWIDAFRTEGAALAAGGSQPYDKSPSKLGVTGVEDLTLSNFDDKFIETSDRYGETAPGASGHIGKISGGDGNDAIQIWNARYLDKGEKLYKDDPKSPIAGEEMFLTIDGGNGNDALYVHGGDKATIIGGAGRDWIFNASKGGNIYGDFIGGFDIAKQRFVSDMEADGSDIVDGKHIYADNFWYSSDTTIWDAGHYDRLSFYGIPLTGGDTSGGITFQVSGGVLSGLLGATIGSAQKYAPPNKSYYFDYIVPAIQYFLDYSQSINGRPDLIVVNEFEQLTALVDELVTASIHNPDKGRMRIKNFDFTGSYGAALQALLGTEGTLGMVFKKANPIWEILAKLPDTAIQVGLTGGGNAFGPLIDQAATWSAYVARNAKANGWATGGDPLILDLTGRGLNTTQLYGSNIHFDLNNDFFSERTGWIGQGAGLLALDKNGNSKIDDVTELFGSYTGSGLGDLAQYDLNHDGKIDASDAVFSKLRVWQDANGDGVTDAGELQSLSQLGIKEISLNGQAVNGTTPQGTEIRTYSTFTRTDGTTSGVYDAVFGNDQTNTVYRGESGQAAWAGPHAIDVKGFGRITNLGVATANDFGLAELVASRGAAMTTPDLHTLAVQAGDVLGAWGASLNLSRELTPVKTSADGKTLLDRAIYVEDAIGGYFTLKSGAAVLDGQGQVIARPSFAQVLAQGSGWHVEQAWSPSTRGTALQFRDAAPYLMHVVNGRAVIDDYGVQQADGSWALASGTAMKDAQGNTIASPTKADILAQAHSAGTEWRVESFGFNAFANLAVQNIGIDIVNGQVADYTVRVTDQDGSFYVWARNLDRALSLQAKQGTSLAFNLRNYEVDFVKLQQQVANDNRISIAQENVA